MNISRNNKRITEKLKEKKIEPNRIFKYLEMIVYGKIEENMKYRISVEGKLWGIKIHVF